jgi:hypothetical protein
MPRIQRKLSMSSRTFTRSTIPGPLLILINGPSAVGKTTLATRLGKDLGIPVLQKDGFYETLFDAFGDYVSPHSLPLEAASMPLLLYTARMLLMVKKALIIEGSFVHAEQATASFLQLQETCHFTPFMIQCTASGPAILQRFLARMGTPERHGCHFQNDAAFVQHHRETILQGQFPHLLLEGQSIELDMTDLAHYDYEGLRSLLCTVLD